MDLYKIGNPTDEHSDTTAKNHRQMIDLLLMTESCTKFLGCIAEVAQVYLASTPAFGGRALPGIKPTRKWKAGCKSWVLAMLMLRSLSALFSSGIKGNPFAEFLGPRRSQHLLLL